jgi:hypothetical protein
MITSVKPLFEVGDLVGFLDNRDDNHVEDIGIVMGDDSGNVIIQWESDGLETGWINPESNNLYWINFGPNSEKLRLYIELRYLRRDNALWNDKN